jgi:hypothetical protein
VRRVTHIRLSHFVGGAFVKTGNGTIALATIKTRNIPKFFFIIFELVFTSEGLHLHYAYAQSLKRIHEIGTAKNLKQLYE